MAATLSFIFCCTNYQTMRLSILKTSNSFYFLPLHFFLATKQADDENKKKICKLKWSYHTLIKKAFTLQTFGFKTMRVSKCQISPRLPGLLNCNKQWEYQYFKRLNYCFFISFSFFYCCPPTFLSWQPNKLIKNTKIENWSDHNHHTLIKKAFNLQTFGFKTMRVSKCQNSPWLPRKLNFNKQWECFNISKHWITTFFLYCCPPTFFLGNQTSW